MRKKIVLRRGAIAIAVLAIVVALFASRWERTWSVRVVADEATVAPWTAVTLHAKVSPSPERESEWTWKWTSTAGVVSGNGSMVQLKTGTPGEHRVHVVVRSPRGTERSADAIVTVKAPEFMAGLATPILVTQPEDDPIPDVVRADLPFRIVDVTVDKPEVCRGERVMVSVRAEHDEGKADWLVPAIAGRVGWSVSLVVPGSKPGRYKIPVQVGDPGRAPAGAPIDYVQTGAYVVLKDCEGAMSLWVTSQQPTPDEEDVRFRATLFGSAPGAPREQPRVASYVWSFGDDSPSTTTTTPDERHVFPNEEARGPGKRIFTFVVRVEARDESGAVMATGKLDVNLRNHHEELKLTDRRLQLIVVFHPEPKKEESGERTVDVTLKNIDPVETANLSALEFRLMPCAADQAPSVQRRSVSEVFRSASVLPRGALEGRLRWSKTDSAEVCNVDVSVIGTSHPSGFTVGGAFSMRTGYDLGVDVVDDPDQSKGIARAMALLHKSFVTQEDLEGLVKAGDLPPAVLKRPTGGPVPRPR